MIGIGMGCEEFSFGDIVELSGETNPRNEWINRPAWFLFRRDSRRIPTMGFWYENERGDRRIPAGWKDPLVILHPQDVLWKNCGWNWDTGQLSEADVIATTDRVIIQHRPRPRMSVIEDPRWWRYPTLAHEPLGIVISVGPQAREIELHQWVTFEADRGTRVILDSGTVLTSIHEEDVLAVCDNVAADTPPVEWRHRDGMTAKERLRQADEQARRWGDAKPVEYDRDPLEPISEDELEELLEILGA